MPEIMDGFVRPLSSTEGHGWMDGRGATSWIKDQQPNLIAEARLESPSQVINGQGPVSMEMAQGETFQAQGVRQLTTWPVGDDAVIRDWRH